MQVARNLAGFGPSTYLYAKLSLALQLGAPFAHSIDGMVTRVIEEGNETLKN